MMLFYYFSRAYLRNVMPGMNMNMCNGDITLAYQYTIAVPENELETEHAKLLLEGLKRKQVNLYISFATFIIDIYLQNL